MRPLIRINNIFNKLNSFAAAMASALSAISTAIGTRAPASTALTNTTFTDAVAVAVLNSAPATSPLLSTPISSGIAAPTGYYNISDSGSGVGAVARILGATLSSSSSTAWVDAVNFTGKGVVNFVVALPVVATGGGTMIGYVDIIINGITAVSLITQTNNSGAGTGFAYTLVGCMVLSSNAPISAALDQIPFNVSLQIRYKLAVTGSMTGTMNVWHKFRKTA